jgi:predicted site-specific integrase-resolvase
MYLTLINQAEGLGKVPIIKLEDSDFSNICELLKTFKLSEVAIKYDVIPQSISRFLTSHETSHKEILKAYRLVVINQAVKDKELPEVTAKRLRVAVNHFYSMRAKLLEGTGFCYWKENGLSIPANQ